MKPVSVGDGHTNQLGDDCRRYRQRLSLDQIHTMIRRHRVQQLIRDRLDAFVRALDDPRCERLVYSIG